MFDWLNKTSTPIQQFVANFAKEATHDAYRAEVAATGPAFQNLQVARQLKTQLGAEGVSARLRGENMGGSVSRRGAAPQVTLGKNAPLSVVAHEFGHATGTRIPSWTPKNYIGKSLALGLGVAALSPDEDLRSAAWMIPAGAAAPRLFEEARASIRGLGAMKKLGLPIGKAAKSMGLAFSTYLIPATAVTGVVALVSNAFAKTPQENRAMYSFDGLSHAGDAQKMRHVMTPFGSKYDRAGWFAKQLGMTVESKGFREVLAGGKVIEELGSGAFGVVHKMRVEAQGKVFDYARKTARYQSARHAEYAGSPKEMFTREASAMGRLSHTKTVPSAYFAEGESLFMELMPGKALYGSGVELPSAAGRLLRQTTREASEIGVWHTDIAARNIMYDPVTKRTSLIDWGSVAFHSPEQSAEALQQMHTNIRRVGEYAAGDPVAWVGAEMSRSATNVLRKRKPAPRMDGMAHGGMAGQKRRTNTPFGSPTSPSKLMGWFKKIGQKVFKSKASWEGGARQLPEKLQAFSRDWQGVTGRAERIKQFIEADIGASGASPVLQKQLRKDLGQFLKGTNPNKAYVVMNPKAIKETAAEEGISYLGHYRGVLRHERFHQGIAQHKVRDSLRLLNDSSFIPGHFQKFAGKNAAEEFLAYSLEQPLVRRKSGYKEAMDLFQGKKETYQQIEALHGKGAAQKLRKVLTDFGSGWRGLRASTSKVVAQATMSGRAATKLTQSSGELRLAQEELWKAAISGGKGHLSPAGKHVTQLSAFGGKV